MIKIGNKETGVSVENKLEVKALVPKTEVLGRVGELSTAKGHPVPDSISSLHS